MNDFNKEEFARILMKIYSKYNNQREFAKKADVCRTYLSKYLNMRIEEPPTVKILKRIVKASKGATTYQELMQVCGYLEENEIIIVKQNQNKLKQILELANGLNIQEANYLIKVLNKSKIQIEESEKENERFTNNKERKI